jgi:hypothetical protein
MTAEEAAAVAAILDGVNRDCGWRVPRLTGPGRRATPPGPVHVPGYRAQARLSGLSASGSAAVSVMLCWLWSSLSVYRMAIMRAVVTGSPPSAASRQRPCPAKPAGRPGPGWLLAADLLPGELQALVSARRSGHPDSMFQRLADPATGTSPSRARGRAVQIRGGLSDL